MFSPDPYADKESLEALSPRRRQPNVLKVTPTLIEPTPDYQRFYNQERLGWCIEMPLPGTSPRKNKSGSHTPGWKLGPLRTKACVEFAFKRKFKLVCALHRARRIQCNCHDFSKLEEGYQMYLTARNREIQEQISRHSTPEYSCLMPDCTRTGEFADLHQIDLDTHTTRGHYEPRNNSFVQQRLLDEVKNDPLKQPHSDIREDIVISRPLSIPYAQRTNYEYMLSGSSKSTVHFSAFCLAYSSQDEGCITSSQPSYSGYSDKLATDIASACPSDPAKIIRGVHQGLFQDCITSFVNSMIEKTAARVWAEHSLRILGQQALEQNLNEVLRCNGLEIGASESDDRIVGVAANLIENYRREISRCFWRNTLSKPSDSGSQTRRHLEETPKQFQAVDKLEQDKNSVVEGFSYNYKVGHSFLQRGEDLFLLRANSFFMQGGPSQSLVTMTRRALYFDDRFKMTEIRDRIENYLFEDRVELPVEFQLDWKPLEFFESQFEGHIPQIGSLVTLTGSAFYAQATTCREYLQSNWPATWKSFLYALQSTMEMKVTLLGSSSTPEHSSTYFNTGDEIKFTFMPDKTLSVLVRGTKQTIIDIAQQISWVSAAFSLSPFGQKVAYCDTSLVHDASQTGLRFKVERSFAQLQSIEQSCWLSPFSNATLAWGFPTPERLGETGLEISIDLMAAIAGVRHVVEYDGGVVMKGFSSMLLPLKRDREADTVQWHLVSSHDEETRISYQEGVDRCSDRALLAEIDLQSLRTTRAILGWCGSAETVLGREEINYENIDYSTAQEVTKPLMIQNAGIGFQQFGAGHIEFTLGPKDGTCHFQRQGPYRMIVDAADKTPVVLFDTGERRAWLVPASGVLLHIARHRCWLDPYISTGKASFKQGVSFRQELLENESLVLFGDEKYKFKDMITDIWSILEFLLDQRVSESKAPGLVVSSPRHDVLRGYEFKAVVENRSPLKAKQWVIEKTSGGWPSLVKDIDALVLFANGFEDLIKPVQGYQGLCHMWKTVPKYKDYLATTVNMLNDLYDVAGCRLSKQYLTSSRLQWHRGDSTLFEACYKANAWQCKCSRLQQILPKALIGEVVPPGLLKDEGGIIFGRSGTRLSDRRRPPSHASMKVDIYSQPNISFSNRDNKSNDSEGSMPSLRGYSTNATQRPILSPPLTNASEPPLPYDEDDSENLDVQYHPRSVRKRSCDPELMEIDEMSQRLNLAMPNKRPRRVDLTLHGSKIETKGSEAKKHTIS